MKVQCRRKHSEMGDREWGFIDQTSHCSLPQNIDTGIFHTFIAIFFNNNVRDDNVQYENKHAD